jgi:hypothetical protein
VGPTYSCPAAGNTLRIIALAGDLLPSGGRAVVEAYVVRGSHARPLPGAERLEHVARACPGRPGDRSTPAPHAPGGRGDPLPPAVGRTRSAGAGAPADRRRRPTLRVRPRRPAAGRAGGVGSPAPGGGAEGDERRDRVLRAGARWARIARGARAGLRAAACRPRPRLRHRGGSGRGHLGERGGLPAALGGGAGLERRVSTGAGQARVPRDRPGGTGAGPRRQPADRTRGPIGAAPDTGSGDPRLLAESSPCATATSARCAGPTSTCSATSTT